MVYPKAVVFDLDGTLVDTAGDLHLILSGLMSEEGLPTPPLAAMRDMVGDGAKVLLARAFASAGVTPDPARLEELYALFLERYTAEPCRRSTLYPGAAELLATLAAEGCGIGLCTNKPQRPSELLLQALGVIDRFGAIVGGDTLPVRKPDPAHLVAVLDRLGAGPGGRRHGRRQPQRRDHGAGGRRPVRAGQLRLHHRARARAGGRHGDRPAGGAAARARCPPLGRLDE